MDEDDIKVLNVRAGSSQAAYRAAYIALAKQWHPDVNNSPEAVATFSRLSVAYANSLQSTIAPTEGGFQSRRLSVVRCTCCSSEINFPNKTEFVGVFSCLLWSRRWKVPGVFCRHCARSAALKTSAVSAIFGWWSVQGVVLTPVTIFRNLTGGRRDKEADFRLSCHNLFALSAAGDFAGAKALARVITSRRQSLPLSVVSLISSLNAHASGPGR